MHVTLIRPPKITTDFAPHTQSGVPPIALACLAAVLEEAGHRVSVIDAYGEAPNRAVDIPGTNLNTVGLTAEDIAAALPADTDVIGLTCMFSQDWLYAKRVIAAVHEAAPRAPIIVGGEHVTADPSHVLRTAPAVTACALGEGEETLVEFVDAVARGGDLQGVAGLALRGPRRCRGHGGAPPPHPRRRRPAVAGMAPRPDLARVSRQPFRVRGAQPPFDADDGDARLPVPLHVLLEPVDVGNELVGARPA